MQLKNSSKTNMEDSKTHDPETAVIMSIYKNDRINFVKQSVESILNQISVEFDYYIVFDGPINDEVKMFIRSLQNPNVILIERDENKGLAYSLNQLLRLALKKGYKYVARMDADDISMPNRFFTQIEYLQKHTDVDCVGTWAIEINADGSEYFRKQMPQFHSDCLKMFGKRDCLIHPTVMFRRTFFDKAGLYPEDTYFAEDTMMWANGFASGCKFANISEYLLKFRLDTNFFNRRRGWKHAKSIWKLRRKVNKMLGFGLKENCYAALYALAKMMPKYILDLIYKTSR